MTQKMLNRPKSIRTTVTLPDDLAKRSQYLVDTGQAPSRNALIISALEEFVAKLEQEEIDRQFAAMAEDTDYRVLNEKITGSFADSDWEAWTMAERSGA